MRLAPPSESAELAVTTRCLNCGSASRGEYCAECGQHRPRERLSLPLLLDGLVEQLAFERGLPRTLREMLLHPGVVIRSYLDGKRRRYCSPITYFFFGAATAVLAYRLHHHRLAAFLEEQAAGAAAGPHPLFTPSQAAAFRELLFQASQQPAYRGLVMCVPFALMLRLLFGGQKLNLAEAMVFSLFTIGHAFLLHSVLVAPAFRLLPELGPWLWLGLLPYLIAAGHTSVGCFGEPWRTLPRVVLALAVSLVCFIVLLAASATAFVLLRVA